MSLDDKPSRCSKPPHHHLKIADMDHLQETEVLPEVLRKKRGRGSTRRALSSHMDDSGVFTNFSTNSSRGPLWVKSITTMKWRSSFWKMGTFRTSLQQQWNGGGLPYVKWKRLQERLQRELLLSHRDVYLSPRNDGHPTKHSNQRRDYPSSHDTKESAPPLRDYASC